MCIYLYTCIVSVRKGTGELRDPQRLRTRLVSLIRMYIHTHPHSARLSSVAHVPRSFFILRRRRACVRRVLNGALPRWSLLLFSPPFVKFVVSSPVLFFSTRGEGEEVCRHARDKARVVAARVNTRVEVYEWGCFL